MKGRPQQPYLVGMAAATVILSWFLVSEGWDRWAQVLASLQALQRQGVARLDSVHLSRKRDELVTQRDSLAALPAARGAIVAGNGTGLYELLARRTKATGVVLRSFSPKEPAEGGRGKEELYRIMVSGSYYRIRDFLHAMEGACHNVWVSRVEFRAGGRERPIDAMIDLLTRSGEAL